NLRPLPSNPSTSSRPMPPAAPVTSATRCCLLILSSVVRCAILTPLLQGMRSAKCGKKAGRIGVGSGGTFTDVCLPARGRQQPARGWRRGRTRCIGLLSNGKPARHACSEFASRDLERTCRFHLTATASGASVHPVTCGNRWALPMRTPSRSPRNLEARSAGKPRIEVVKVEKDNRRRIKRQRLADDQPADNRITERL